MASKVYHHLLNVGVVDADKLHRVDLDRMRLAAADQTNLIPFTTGAAQFRPGLKYIDGTKAGADDAWLVPFVAAEDEAFVLEFADGYVRFRKASDETLVTRDTVTASVSSGDFSASTGWTLASASGQSTTVSGGYLQLIARAHGAEAVATCTVTINEVGVEHGLSINVAQGPVTFRLGSSSGADDLIAETTLKTGLHSLAFTPTGNVFIRFSTKDSYLKKIDSCQIDSAGAIALATPYADGDLPTLQVAQSLDVLFMACRGYQRKRIERRGDASWSIVNEDSDDGPFMSAPISKAKITPSALEGSVTLSSDIAFFTSDMVGSLIMLTHKGQRLDTYLAAADVYTNPVEVTGVNETTYNDRDFTYTLSGTWVATVHVQRSFDSELVGYQAFRREQSSSTIDITANATYIDDDNEDNATTWYRVGIEPGSYTSGEVHVTLQYSGGQGFGIARITGYTSSTSVTAQVLSSFMGSDATDDWRLGQWSDYAGWPAALAFSDGRLVWAGDDTFNASISDAYSNFDENYEGDAGPILRSIAVGGRNESRWMLQMPSGLIIGTDSRVVEARSNSFDTPITPTDLKLTSISRIGVAPVSPVETEDNRALFVEKGTTMLYELTYDARYNRYIASPFTKLTTDIFSSGIRQMAVSILPDQRVWCVMNDGTAAVIVYEPDEKVIAFVPIASRAGDLFKSVCVVQDRVWFCMERSINGATDFTIEKLALDSEGRPGDVSVCMDAYVSQPGVQSAVVTGLTHLEGEDVVAWVDGAPVMDGTDVATFTVSGGSITLPADAQLGWCVGLPYDFTYETARLEYGVANQNPMLNIKAVAGVSVLFSDYVRAGIRIGTRNADGVLSATDGLPAYVRGKAPSNVVAGVVGNDSTYPVPGGASLDQRLRITGSSPCCATILGFVMEIANYGG